MASAPSAPLHTSKLWSEFIGKLNTAKQLDAAYELIMKGQSRPVLGDVKQTCFYSKGDGTVALLCPYLVAEAKRMLMVRHRDVALRIDIDEWVQVVQLDLKRQLTPQRTPRIGWNVEGLVLDIMRHQERVFLRDENTVFKHCVGYSNGGEVEACDKLTDVQLDEGVLLVPRAFNEKAIDALFVRVRESVLHFYALQITIATWKRRSKEDSHLVWKTEVLPAWRSQFKQAVEDKYYYIMPENITEANLPPGDQSSEVTVEFRTLADVRDNLKRFDTKLMLTEPAILQARAMNLCKGRNSDNCTPCGNWVENGGYCMLHDGSDGRQLYLKKQRIELGGNIAFSQKVQADVAEKWEKCNDDTRKAYDQLASKGVKAEFLLKLNNEMVKQVAGEDVLELVVKLFECLPASSACDNAADGVHERAAALLRIADHHCKMEAEI